MITVRNGYWLFQFIDYIYTHTHHHIDLKISIINTSHIS